MGVCTPYKCNSANETLCTEPVTDFKSCINVKAGNPDHCGDCYKKCDSAQYASASFTACVGGTCQYICKEGYEDCNKNPAAPLCLSRAERQSNADHCKECNNRCGSEQLCSGGECVNSKCPGSCETNNCTNSPTACGTKCTNCRNLPNLEAAVCEKKEIQAGGETRIEWDCKVTECTPGFTIAADRKSCISTSSNYCGPVDGVGKSCTMLAGASAMKCDGGTCKIASCEEGLYLSNNTCLANTEFACGDIKNSCYKISNSVLTECIGNECKVVECAPNYHPDSAYTQCVDNTDAACAPVRSPETKECSVENYAGCRFGVCIAWPDRNTTACANNSAPISQCPPFDENTSYPHQYCVINTNSYCWNRACSTDENYSTTNKTYCGKGKCFILLNGATCDKCNCNNGQVCYKKSDVSYGCRDNLVPEPPPPAPSQKGSVEKVKS